MKKFLIFSLLSFLRSLCTCLAIESQSDVALFLKRGVRLVKRGVWEAITYMYCISYTSNLGFGVAVFNREREQSHFRGSTGGSKGVQHKEA